MTDNNCLAKQDPAVVQTRQHAQRPVFTPPIDVVENDTGFVVTADVPGARPEDVEVSFEDHILTFKAQVAPREADQTRYILREYRVGNYERSLRLGEDIDAERIEANLSGGVLTLTLPKRETARRRTIAINAG